MQIRPSIILSIAFVIALIALMLWQARKLPIAPLQNTVVQTNSVSLVGGVSNAPISAPPMRVTKSTDLQKSQSMSKVERSIGLLSDYNDQPIVFYGKIEDQFSNIVENAAVTFGVRIMNGYESTVKSGQVKSDINGLFTISGYRGQDLGIGVEKAGYVLLSMNGSGIYSKLWPEDQRAHPDANNPTVIKMWKLQGAQPLINFNFKTYIPIDGTPVQFNLKTGQQVQGGGDLIVRLQSTNTPSVRKEYDWQASVQMASGGIIQDSSGLGLQKMFQAPDSGYDHEFDLILQKNTPPWTPRYNSNFYFEEQGNNYGKLWLEIDTDVVKNDTAYIVLKGYLNPSGSRNLELDSQ